MHQSKLRDKNATFSTLLSNRMDKKNIGDAKLASTINTLVNNDNFIHRSNIRNWRTGTSQTVRDWRQWIGIAHVLGIEKEIVEYFLLNFGHPHLSELGKHASPPFKTMVHTWLTTSSQAHSLNQTNGSTFHETVHKKASEESWQSVPIEHLKQNEKKKSYSLDLPSFLNRKTLLIAISFLTIVIFLFLLTPTLESLYTQWKIRNGWWIHIDGNDDKNVLLINDVLVMTTDWGIEDAWVSLDKYLTEEENEISLVHINGPDQGDWNFTLYHQGETVWFEDNTTYDEFSTRTIRTFKISSVDEVLDRVPRYTGKPQNLVEDEWHISFHARDIGVLLINGEVAAGTYDSWAGDFPRKDISSFLNEGENHIKIMIWNTKASYSYDLLVYKNSELVWSGADRVSGSGKPSTGLVICLELSLNSNGTIIDQKKC